MKVFERGDKVVLITGGSVMRIGSFIDSKTVLCYWVDEVKELHTINVGIDLIKFIGLNIDLNEWGV
jgi:uncharacterized protein YodC (DUF2158 family)